jgi:hypothetical protein
MDAGDVRQILINWGGQDHVGKSFRILESHYDVVDGIPTLLVDRVEVLPDSTKGGER